MSYREAEDSLCRLVDLTEKEQSEAGALCRECFKEITAGLKADADSEDARITAAAAGLAYYKLILKRNSSASAEEITDFKAGDVSIKQGKSDTAFQLRNAESYFKECFSKIVPMLEDNSFAFCNVKVKVIP